MIEKNKKVEAIELYRKANKNTDAARLLAEIALEMREKNAPLLLIKKIYVLAALKWTLISRECLMLKLPRSLRRGIQQLTLQPRP